MTVGTSLVLLELRDDSNGYGGETIDQPVAQAYAGGGSGAPAYGVVSVSRSASNREPVPGAPSLG